MFLCVIDENDDKASYQCPEGSANPTDGNARCRNRKCHGRCQALMFDLEGERHSVGEGPDERETCDKGDQRRGQDRKQCNQRCAENRKDQIGQRVERISQRFSGSGWASGPGQIAAEIAAILLV
jgi:hypothetical protein